MDLLSFANVINVKNVGTLYDSEEIGCEINRNQTQSIGTVFRRIGFQAIGRLLKKQLWNGLCLGQGMGVESRSAQEGRKG
ncbi:hypothetical protein EZS27_011957 [termite gut metagenome]|uniref:Uncharacterized protein n=1 Tax=termite gut metagenome TaxID=433724 RepID=A0A5J4S435_9ZZZZ